MLLSLCSGKAAALDNIIYTMGDISVSCERKDTAQDVSEVLSNDFLLLNRTVILKR